LLLSNGTSTKFPRPLRTTTGSHTLSISNPTVALTISDVLLLTQDGGNYSDTKELLLLTREERYSKYKVASIQRTETLESINRTIRSINNGILFTLMNGKESQPRDNSIKDSVFMLKEISMLSPNSQITDTST